MTFSLASRLADRHDLVLVGYRGIDSSVRLDCPEVSSALKRSTDYLGQKSFRAYTQALRDCAARLQEDGVDLAGYTLPQQVDDFEAARRALGYKRIDLVSESAGTRLAMIYAWRYPRSIHRSVMIDVNPPGHFLWSPQATDELIGRYSRLCARDAGCSSRTDDLAASMRKTAAHLPGRFLGLPISRNDARIATFYSLMESTSESAPLTAPMAIDTWLSAADGDASGLWFLSLLARMAFPESFTWGELAAVAQGRHLRRRPLLRAGAAPQGLDPGQRRDRVHLRRRRPDPRVPAGSRCRRVHARAGLGRRDAPRRRHARLRDAAEVRDAGAAAAPPQRPPGRARGARPRRHLLVVRAEGEHAAPERVLRQRPGRHLALHPGEGRLHAGRDADGPRQGLRRHDARPAARSCSSRSC